MTHEDRIHKKLSKQTFAGRGASEFHKLHFKEFRELCSGRLLVAIGAGCFQEEMVNVIAMSMSYGAYQEAYVKASTEALKQPNALQF
jgi:hypothetical protein